MLSGSSFGADEAVASGFAFASARAGRALADALAVAASLAATASRHWWPTSPCCARAMPKRSPRSGSARRRRWPPWRRSSGPSAGRRRSDGRRAPGPHPMTTASVVLLVVAGFFAVGDWVARGTKNAPLEYLCKPATVLALIGAAVAARPGPRRRHPARLVRGRPRVLARRRRLAHASLRPVRRRPGRVPRRPPLLCRRFLGPRSRRVAFLVRPRWWWPSSWRRSVVASWAHGTRRELGVPVALYMVVISVMLATALATGNVAAAMGRRCSCPPTP